MDIVNDMDVGIVMVVLVGSTSVLMRFRATDTSLGCWLRFTISDGLRLRLRFQPRASTYWYPYSYILRPYPVPVPLLQCLPLFLTKMHSEHTDAKATLMREHAEEPDPNPDLNRSMHICIHP